MGPGHRPLGQGSRSSGRWRALTGLQMMACEAVIALLTLSCPAEASWLKAEARSGAQVEALLEIKRRLFSPVEYPKPFFSDWIQPEKGGSPAVVCNWTGVMCARAPGGAGREVDVVALNLDNSEWSYPLWPRHAPAGASADSEAAERARQSLPPELGALTALTLLDLQKLAVYKDGMQFVNQGLVGSIPDAISRLRRLQVLRLHRNSISGSIPSSISALSMLQELNLRENLLSGPFPTLVCQLQGLTFLDLSYNHFTGRLPECLSLLSRLSNLYVERLPITGPLPLTLGSMSSLTALTLKGLPSIAGSIPPSLSSLSRLQSLTVSGINISGTLPGVDWWAALPSLAYLKLYDIPSLSGSLPEVMGPSVSGVFLRGLGLTGGIPESLIQSFCGKGRQPGPDGSVASLEALLVQDTPLGGSIPESFSTCASLVYIVLQNVSLEGAVPKALFNSLGPTLQTFNVGSNRLNMWGPGINVLGKLQKLMTFNLSHNLFEGPAPSLICASPVDTVESFHFRVMHFNIQSNRFQGDVARVLWDKAKCPDATFIDVSSNRLSGSLPASWPRGARELNVRNNSIAGAIPPVLPKDCAQLISLDASSNNLMGAIPVSLPNDCPYIASLDLSNNALSGRIPSLVGDRGGANLRTLDLSGNKLWGGIPPSLSRASGLEALDLSSNLLSESIPSELGKILSLRRISLSQNTLSESIPPSLSRFSGLTSLNLSGNLLSGSIPSELGNIVTLGQLALSRNTLSGPIPTSLGSLIVLSALTLSQNNLTGPLPLQLAPPFLPNLSSLDVSCNRLTGPVPWGFQEPRAADIALNLSHNNLSGPVPGNSSSPLAARPWDLAGNPNLCGGAGYPDCPAPEESSPVGLSPAASAGTIVGCLCAAALVGALVAWWLLKMEGRDAWEKGMLLVFWHLEPPPTIRKILEATKYFSEAHELGRGGFGAVYKAALPDGTEVAIKRLAAESKQGHEEFVTEVQTLSTLRHRNIVSLVAAYIAAPPLTERLLVYEFLPGGSLDQILLQELPEGSPFRTFEQRHRVALDVAKGMRYLHSCNPPIIHRDMKPANVIMGSDLVARVADFGLAKEMDMGRTHMTDFGVLGTAGFVAPEYSLNFRMSTKSDVYSFGVTLIALISGRRTTDEEIVDRGLQRWIGLGAEIIDPQLNLSDTEQVHRVLACLLVGKLCIAKLPCDRPSMEEVVDLLENLQYLATDQAQ